MVLLPRAWLDLPLLALGLAIWTPAHAQDYPTRDVRVICNFPAGTSGDVFVRYFADKLSVLSGRAVTVENRAGAFGNKGTEAAAKAKPDGHTALISPGSSTLAAASATFKKLKFDPIKDFAPVTTLARLGYVVAVDAQSRIRSLAELTAYLKSNADDASYGVSSTAGQVVAELYKKHAGVMAKTTRHRDMQRALTSLRAGDDDFVVGEPTWAIEQARTGRIRPLAVSLDRRMSALPDVPTMEEAGVGGFGKLEIVWGVYVPAATSPPIVGRLEDWFNKIVAMAETRTFLNNLGFDALPGNSKVLAELTAEDVKRWRLYVELAGIEPQ